MFEVYIDSVRVSLVDQQRVVILKERTTDRYLPIWIGPAEADAIAVKLQEVTVPRPLTHDLIGSVIAKLGGNVEKIVVSDLSDDTFYAKIVLSVNGGQQELDCRPSDALAVAVRAQAPIFVTELVMEKAGITIDKEGNRPSSRVDGEQKHPSGRMHEPVTEAELKGLSAFEDFIVNLEGLEELGSGGSSSIT